MHILTLFFTKGRPEHLATDYDTAEIWCGQIVKILSQLNSIICYRSF